MAPVRYLKVVAYVTRRTSDGSTQLLVFDHRDYPEAGTQVPAGTVEQGESIDDALAREVSEETGRDDFRPVRMVAHYDWTHPRTANVHERHVFHLEAPPGVPDEWITHDNDGGTMPEGQAWVLLYRWVDLHAPVELAGDLGDHLDTLRALLP